MYVIEDHNIEQMAFARIDEEPQAGVAHFLLKKNITMLFPFYLIPSNKNAFKARSSESAFITPHPSSKWH